MNITISPDDLNNYKIRSAAPSDSHRRKDPSAVSGNAVYDTLSISGKTSVPDDSDFAAALAKACVKEVSSGVSEDRVAQLRSDVQSGAYVADSARIAEKLLGYRS